MYNWYEGEAKKKRNGEYFYVNPQTTEKKKRMKARKCTLQINSFIMI